MERALRQGIVAVTVSRPRLTSVHFEWMPADQIAELVHRQVTDPQPPTGITGWARMSLVARDSS